MKKKRQKKQSFPFFPLFSHSPSLPLCLCLYAPAEYVLSRAVRLWQFELNDNVQPSVFSNGKRDVENGEDLIRDISSAESVRANKNAHHLSLSLSLALSLALSLSGRYVVEIVEMEREGGKDREEEVSKLFR